MVGKTGKDWFISQGTGTYLGGKVLDAEPSVESTTFSEPGTGQRALATPPIVTQALPRLRWTMNIQRLVDYITAKAIITAEGDPPSHTLYTTEGQNPHDLTEGRADRCELRVRRGESVKAILDVIGKTWGTTAFQAGTERTEDPIDWTNVSTLTVGGTPITNWRELSFLVNNNVAQEWLGTTLTPTEVYTRAVVYSGFIERSVQSGGSDYFADVQAGTKRTVVIAFTDHQTTPVTKTFTLANCVLRVSRKPVRELDLIMERVEYEGASLVIT